MKENIRDLIFIIIFVIGYFIIGFIINRYNKPVQDNIKIDKTEYYGKGVRQSGYIHNHINNI